MKHEVIDPFLDNFVRIMRHVRLKIPQWRIFQRAREAGGDYQENQMSLSEKDVVFVEHAEPAGELRLKLFFSDGAQRVVDFRPFLSGSRNCLIRAYLDPAVFAQFAVKDGDLVWGDYDLCFPIADLYEGSL